MRRSIGVLLVAAAVQVAVVFPAAAPGESPSALIAPAAACPGTGDAEAPAGRQDEAMLCMTNYARRQMGLRELGEPADLDRSALRKSGDILRCDSFSHEACGREFTYWMRRVGYLQTSCWRAAENIGWVSGTHGTVRSIFVAWMHSQVHRENILGPYRQIGIGLRIGGLEGNAGAHVWTQEFGSHC